MEESGNNSGDLDGEVIFNDPGCVAAVGGKIPDEVKIFGGISFSFPFATPRYPETLTEDPIERQKIQDDGGKVTTKKNLNNFVRALNKAIGVSSLSGQSEAYNEDEEPHTLVQVNLDLDVYQFSRECKMNGYSISTSEGAHGFLKMLRRDCGDHIETLFYKGVIKNTPGIIVIAAGLGGVPNELKINGGVSVWFPCPTMKIRKNLLFNHALRSKAIYDAYMEAFGPDACLNNIKQGYNKARHSSDFIPESTFGMIEINFVESTGVGSFSNELNKDSMGIDTSTERAYRKALGISLEYDQLEEEKMETAHNIDQKLPAMTELINGAAPEDILGLSSECHPGTSCMDVHAYTPGVPLVHVEEGGYVGNLVISNSAPVNINGFVVAPAKRPRLQRYAHYHPLVKHPVNIDVEAAGGGDAPVGESGTALGAQNVVGSATGGESDE